MFQDVGAGVNVVSAGAIGAVVQSSATQSALTGVAVDLQGLARKYNSVKVAVPVEFSLSSGETFSAKVDLQHRSATAGAGSTWANFGTTGRTYTSDAGATGATTTGAVTIQVCKEGEGVFRTAKRYVRAVVTGGQSGLFIDATATSAESIKNHYQLGAPVFIFGTADELPASG